MTHVGARTPKAYRSAVKPIWCPGCGHFAVLNALSKAFASLGADPDRTVLVSGIGCSSRLPAYMESYGFHGVHGRALAVAQGLKVARPDLCVLALGGDGDGFSIGGNHFLHACRRNVDITYVAMDNEVYGMTKGQASPTTPIDWDHSPLTPHGPGIRPFNPALTALAAGAPWIARGYSGNPNQMAKLLVEAIRHPGFSFLHVLSQCITFCPEQTDWKAVVHERTDAPCSTAEEAAALMLQGDGFTTGLLYAQPRTSWPPVPGAADSPAAVEALTQAFAVAPP